METVRIPLRGIETQDEITNGVDGSCSKVKNLVPAGPDKSSPSFWKPLESGGFEKVRVGDGVGDYPKTLSSYYHKRKYKESGSVGNDVNRWLLLLENSDNTKRIYNTRVQSVIESSEKSDYELTDNYLGHEHNDIKFSPDGMKAFVLMSSTYIVVP